MMTLVGMQCQREMRCARLPGGNADDDGGDARIGCVATLLRRPEDLKFKYLTK